jgi:hypothetical protein
MKRKMKNNLGIRSEITNKMERKDDVEIWNMDIHQYGIIEKEYLTLEKLLSLKNIMAKGR